MAPGLQALPHRHEDLSLSLKNLMLKLCACNPSSGRQKQEGPWGSPASSLAQLVSSRFTQNAVSQNKMKKQMRKIPTVDLCPVHIHAPTRIHAPAHKFKYLQCDSTIPLLGIYPKELKRGFKLSDLLSMLSEIPDTKNQIARFHLWEVLEQGRRGDGKLLGAGT